MFSSKISIKSLSLICRSLATLLQSGVPLLKALTNVSQRIGTPDCRKHLRAVLDQLKAGDDVRSAFRSQGDYFPDLFVDMLAVAEDTGALPEVLLSLADHYENLVELKRNFIGHITMPLLQLVASIFIITCVIYVIGMIGSTIDGKPIDVLGWGLTGTAGAATFFFGSFGAMFGLYFLYVFLSQGLKQGYRIHALLLGVPVLGPCLRSFAIARFAWAYALTQQAGMRIVPSLESSLKATANQAFIAATPRMSALINQGEDFSTVLQDSRLFTKELEEMVEVAETSGTVPEMLERMSPRFEDQARRSLSMLAAALGWLVWALVAGFIIVAIFSLARFYLDTLKGVI